MPLETDRGPEAPRAAMQAYAMRGSLLVSTLDELRQLGHHDRYRQLLDPTWRDEAMFCLASSWVPMELAVAHYEALDALALSPGELVALSERVSERVAGPFVGSLLRTRRTHGLSPSAWAPLRDYQRLFERLVRGGSVAMRPLGDQEALLEIGAVSLLRFAAFQQTMLALTRLVVGSFARRAFVKTLSWSAEPEQLRISVRWL